ncbi:ABC transporter ATP-binding protein [Rickettsiales bacterium]|nr:ABC transporter ATP-binding protein [Rickettsiales bacterium]
MQKQNYSKNYKSCFKLLLQYASSYKFLIIGFIIALTISSLSVLSLGTALRFLIDSGFKVNDSLNYALLILLSIVAFLSIATSLRFYFVTLLSEKIILQIRQDVFYKLINQSQTFFSKNKIGNLISSVTNDLSVIQSFIASNLSILLRNLIILIGAIVILSSTNISLFLYIIVLIPIVVLPLMLFIKKLKRQSKETQNVIGDLTSYMHEHLSGIKTIQAFSAESYSKENFNNQQNIVLNFSKRRIFTRSLLTLVIILLVFSTILFLIKKAGLLLLSNQITAGELSSFVFFSLLVAGAFGAIAEVIGNLFKSIGAFERIYEILQDSRDDETITPSTSFQEMIFPIKFNNVNFAYQAKKEILTNVNLSIQKNKITAIVGPSGSGKSTIFNLLLAFYKIDSGSISFADTNYEELNRNIIRSKFSLVPQDPFMFSGSIAENIALTKDFNIERIQKALTDAQAMNFIDQFGQGIYTDLTENGTNISSGQKQRLAIARAIYHKSSVILLDEATSNIDNKNEQNLIKFLKNLSKHYTIVIIAHRRETIQNSDYIYVLDKGRIVDEGNDNKLNNKKGLYKTLLGMQSA